MLKLTTTAAIIILANTAFALEHLVEYALPRGAGRGETVTVQFFGLHLDQAVEVVSYRAGLRCSEVRSQKAAMEETSFTHGGKVKDVVSAKIEIAPDCPLGEHLLRVRTRTLLSEPVTFWVGPFPTVHEAETQCGENDVAAQVVARNSTISGRILPGDDVDRDCFAIDLQQGERLSADLESVRLGTQHHGGENDCILRLLGPEGAELGRSDDTALTIQDPRLSVIAPSDGRYVVEVSQQLHTPGERCLYRLHLGTFAQPTTAFPLGGQPGEKLALTLFGDPAGKIETTLTLPSEVTGSRALRGFAFHLGDRTTDFQSVAPTDGLEVRRTRNADDHKKLSPSNKSDRLEAYPTITPTGLPLRVTPHRNFFETTLVTITPSLPKAAVPQPKGTTDFQSVAPIDGLEVRRTKTRAEVMKEVPNSVSPPLPRSPSPQLPLAFNGTISNDGETDRWHFTATKGERLDVRVFARGLGSPLDSKIAIRRASAPAESAPLAMNDDGSLGDHDFWSCHDRLRPKALLDSVLSFVAPESGEFVLDIEDTRGIGGPEHHYRIEVDRHVDGMHPYVRGQFAFKIPRSVAFTVPRENRWTLSVSLAEGLGTKPRGDVLLEAIGLPPGVTMIAPRYSQGLRQMPVQFVASADAKPGTSMIQLIAKYADGSPLDGSPQQNLTYVDRRGGFAWHSVFVDEFALAVVDPAPFRLECTSSSVSLARSGEITLDLKIIRDAGFDEPLELQTDWLPPGVEKGPPVVIAKGQTAAQLRLRATANALGGTWPITVTGTTVNGEILTGAGCRLVTTPIISLYVSDPYLSVTFQRAAIERGKRGQLIADLTHNKPFAGTATATLLRLPHGVKLLDPKPTITAKDKTCVFEVEVTKDALIGPYKEIAAEITIIENGQPIRQQSGSGVLRVDPERK